MYEASVKKKSVCNLTTLKSNHNLAYIYGYVAHDSEHAAMESSGFMSRD